MAGEIVIHREGRLLRSEQELALLLIEDTVTIAKSEDPEDFADASEMNYEALRAFGTFHDETVMKIADEAEILLVRMGYEVRRHEGFTIHRV